MGHLGSVEECRFQPAEPVDQRRRLDAVGDQVVEGGHLDSEEVAVAVGSPAGGQLDPLHGQPVHGADVHCFVSRAAHAAVGESIGTLYHVHGAVRVDRFDVHGVRDDTAVDQPVAVTKHERSALVVVRGCDLDACFVDRCRAVARTSFAATTDGRQKTEHYCQYQQFGSIRRPTMRRMLAC